MTKNLRTPGRRSQAEAEQTRARLLDAAEGLFARRGYQGTSLRAVAAAVGVRPFTVQHHFGSKRGLYEAVVGRWDQQLMESVSRLGADLDPLEALDGIVDAVFDFFLGHRDWVAVTAWAALGDGPPGGVRLQDRTWVEFMQKALAESGLAGSLDPGLLFITMEGILNHHVLSRAHYEHLCGSDVTNPKLCAETREHLKRVMKSILTGNTRGRRA